MTHIVVKLASGLGVEREFVLDKRKGRMTVSYVTATVSAGQSQASMMQFAVNDLFTLVETVWGPGTREILEKAQVLTAIAKKLEEDG